MKKKSYVFIFTLIVLLFSILACNKDKTLTETYPASPNATLYDTIFPLNYFPVFPGSWWKYLDSNNDTTITKTDSIYQLDYYSVSWLGYVSDTFFVPIYNDIPIWGYEAHTGSIGHSGTYPFRRILSDSLPVGSSWIIYNWHGLETRRKIIVKDTTIIISSNSYGPTIVIEEYQPNAPPNLIWIATRYFTKNIGMIREDINNYEDSTVNSKNIIDYYINN